MVFLPQVAVQSDSGGIFPRTVLNVAFVLFVQIRSPGVVFPLYFPHLLNLSLVRLICLRLLSHG